MADLKPQDVIRQLCLLQEEVFNHLGPDDAADCFCKEGGFWELDSYDEFQYRNDGVALQFIIDATRDRIQKETQTVDTVKYCCGAAVGMLLLTLVIPILRAWFPCEKE